MSLHNLIKPYSRLSGPQYAGWQPRGVAEDKHDMVLEADVMIEVAKGISLSADIYRPKDAGHYPAIVQFSAYNRDLFTVGAHGQSHGP